ncbi:hypothetical protein ACROYT_G018951 [Oculina patagonica]
MKLSMALLMALFVLVHSQQGYSKIRSDNSLRNGILRRKPLQKQLSFTPSAQPPLHTNSLFSAARTEYPDASAARPKNSQKETVDGSGEAAVITSSLERRRPDALLTN